MFIDYASEASDAISACCRRRRFLRRYQDVLQRGNTTLVGRKFEQVLVQATGQLQKGAWQGRRSVQVGLGP